jgi:hypothetical protein
MQPEIFQEPSAHSIIQLCSSVHERKLNNTVPLKCVPIGSTVFPRRDIEERCVIPLGQKKITTIRNRKAII